MVFMSDIFPHFEKGVKGDNFNIFNGNPYLVLYYCKVLLPRKIMSLIRGFYNTPGQNGGLSKETSWLTWTGCHFGQG